MGSRQSTVENMGVSLSLSASIWHGRRVFITGHTGFKGGWLSLWLSSLGAKITGYALAANTEPNYFTAANIGECINSVIADIRDYTCLLEAMRQAQPEIIFHLAAQPLVRRAYRDPRETYETNVMGTVNVLEAARHTPGVHGVVIVTSDKCYENREVNSGYAESDPMGGHDPYSSSKGCAELVTSAFRHSYFSSNAAEVLIASARAGNVIGGGDWSEDRLIPDLLRAFSKNAVALIRNPRAIRPWQHVMEPLCGYIMLAERLLQNDHQFASAWNFGPANTNSVPVAQIADQFCKLWGQQAAWQQDANEHPHETHLLALNSDKVRSQLGWQAILPLNAALALIVDWHTAFARGDDMRTVSLGQIQNYSELATAKLT